MDEMREYERDVVLVTLSRTLGDLGLKVMFAGAAVSVLGYYIAPGYTPVRPSEEGPSEEING